MKGDTMSIKEEKIRVHCPIVNRPEIVYVRSVETQEACLALFAGCDNSYHKCNTCDIHCYEKVKEQFTLAYDGSLQIPWHKL